MIDTIFMAKTVNKSQCYFETSDNTDGSFWIFISPQDQPLKLGDMHIGIGLDLERNTPMNEADELAALLRKYVSHVRIWQE